MAKYQFLLRQSSASLSYSRRFIAIIGGVALMILLIWSEVLLNQGPKCTDESGLSWFICELDESVFMGTVETFGFLVAVILFAVEAPDRQRQAINEAWKVIDSAQGIETSYARIDALESLNSRKISLEGLDAVGADLKKIQLEKAKLREANLTDAYLEGANLRRSNLEQASLQNAHMGRINLQGASLREADLQGATLFGANLTDADLQGADLRQVSLQNANLTNCNLKNADLRGVNLVGVDLRRAKTRGAIFSITSHHRAHHTDARSS